MMIQVTPTKYVEHSSIKYNNRNGESVVTPVLKFLGTCRCPDATGNIPDQPQEARFTVFPEQGALPRVESLVVGVARAMEVTRERDPDNKGHRQFSVKTGADVPLDLPEAHVLAMLNGGGGQTPPQAPPPSAPPPGYTPGPGQPPPASNRPSAAEFTQYLALLHAGVECAAEELGTTLPPDQAGTHARTLLMALEHGKCDAPGADYLLSVRRSVRESVENAQKMGQNQPSGADAPGDDNIPF